MFITLDELDAIICTASCLLFGISLLLMLGCICTCHDKWGIFWMCVTLAIITSAFVYSNWGREALRQKFSNQEVSQMGKDNVWKYVVNKVPDSPRRVLVWLDNGGIGAVDIGIYSSESRTWLLKSLSDDVVVKWAELPEEPEIEDKELNNEATKTILDDLNTKVNTMKFDLTEMEETISALKRGYQKKK